MAIHVVSELPTFTGPVGVDTETTYSFGGKHADPHRDRLLLIQVSDGTDAWILKPGDHKAAVSLLESPVIKIIHNANFDLQFLIHNLGVKIPKKSIWDSLLMERLIHAGEHTEMGHGLDVVAARRLGVMLNKDTRDTFKNHDGINFTEEQIRYAGEDVLCLPRIYEQQLADISRLQLGRVAGLENRITRAVAEMSLRGVGFDKELWSQYLPQTYGVMDSIEAEIAETLDMNRQMTLFGGTRLTMNLRSTPQLKELYEQIGMDADSTNKNIVADWLLKHPNFKHIDTVQRLMEWKQWAYISSGIYAKAVNPKTGRIHASWNQIEADTGRFSCSDPNLQNAPRPVKDRPNVRMLFIPHSGYKFLVADYSQQEPKIFAQLSGDPILRAACSEADAYVAMGERVPSHPTRYKMKTGVLAAFYGAQAETLANRMGIPVAEAEVFQQDIQNTFPDAKRFSERLKNAARAHGLTRTLLGRIRYYPEVKEGRISNHILNEMINSPIQGSGADMIKMAIDRIDDVIEERGYDAWPCLTIHDELVLEAAEDCAEEVYYQLVGCMETVGKELCPDVKILAEGCVADRWVKG